MKKIARTVFVVGALMASALSLGACAYGGVTTAGDKVVITRNDLLLYGALRKVYVCSVGDTGLTNCVESAEAP